MSLYLLRYNDRMISVNKALHIIDNTFREHKSEKVRLAEALNRVLFSDIYSPINMPIFRQSAMDGYAIKENNTSLYKVVGESKSGDSKNHVLNHGEAIRIFTGALVPDAADTVIMQEHSVAKKNIITITKMPQTGANIRAVGEQIMQGELALLKGFMLNEAGIGFLASIGVAEVEVYKKPQATIIVSGNELQAIGKPLQEGKVYESNAIMLISALKNIGIADSAVFSLKDDYLITKQRIGEALNSSDIVLICGGISVGDYDFVKQALKDNQVTELFYKVNQKPGKPLWFGKKDKTFVYGLPGNPASALTCFYIYVLPLIRNLCGYPKQHLERIKKISTSNFINRSGKTQFLKARIEDDKASILSGQSSAMLHTYAMSNALVCVDENTSEIKSGDLVECLIL